MQKLVVIMDAYHTHLISRSFGKSIDYKAFREHLMTRGYLVRCHYVAGIDESDEFISIRPLLDWLSYNGYDVVSSPTGHAPFAVHFAISAFEALLVADEILLVTGSAAYAPLAQMLKRRGVRVSVLSSLEHRLVSDELRRAADEFIDIAPIIERIAKKP